MKKYDLSEAGILQINPDLHEEVIQKSSGLYAFQKEVSNFLIASFQVDESRKSGMPNITFFNAAGESFRTHVFELVRTRATKQEKIAMLASLDLNKFKGMVANRVKKDKDTVLTITPSVNEPAPKPQPTTSWS